MPLDQLFNLKIFLMGMAIFLARIVDVTLGTLRTISIIHGRTWMAFGLGFMEILIWLSVISGVVLKIREIPILGLFFALGFAFGNIAGIRVERWLAFGYIVLRVISRKHPAEMADTMRQAGFTVTTFQGEGMTGPVVELYIACRRCNVKELISMVNEIEPDAFYIIEQVGHVNKIYQPVLQPVSGWRAILKKK